VQFLYAHLGTVIGGILMLAFAAVVVRGRRPSASTAAWLLVVLFAPWLGVPLYYFFGGRKRPAKPAVAGATAPPQTSPRSDDPIERVLLGTGQGALAGGHRVEWDADGVQAFERLIETLAAARRSIRIATYVLGDDAVGDAVVDVLVARATAGVRVELLLDGLLLNRGYRRARDRLRAAGGEVAVFEPLFRLPGRDRGRTNLRNHRKICIVDGDVAILGGRNIAHEYMGPTEDAARWDDLSWRLRGPAVARADQVFRADWQFATKRELPRSLRPRPRPHPRPGSTAVRRRSRSCRRGPTSRTTRSTSCCCRSCSARPRGCGSRRRTSRRIPRSSTR
jgi:cardiolipin synthase